MTEDDKRSFKSNNECWIVGGLFVERNNKVRDHDHVTGKLEASVHKYCNINLRLTKKISVIFHNLRGYVSHLIMQEIGRFDAQIDVIPNRLKKYMAFAINRSLVFIDNMQLMSFSLDKLVKNLSDNDFRY